MKVLIPAIVLTFASQLALGEQVPKAFISLGKAQVAKKCSPGYVWREAYPGDVICVEPPRRDAVRSENEIASARVQPGGGAYGPDTCSSGYVWREARPADHVCVTPDSRALVARENSRASQLGPSCGTPENCAREARERQARIEALRQRLAQRQHDLAKAKEDRRKFLEQARKEDEAWARANPGLGRSTQFSISDNISPIEQNIREIEAALEAAERDAAKAQGQANR
jgi:hypothetical protein